MPGPSLACLRQSTAVGTGHAGVPTFRRFRFTASRNTRDNDLILATHGRSIWILDDVTPVRQAAAALAADAFLFDIRPARQFNRAHDRWWMNGDQQF
jgi:hypothetical protein